MVARRTAFWCIHRVHTPGHFRSPQGSHCTSRRGHKPGLHKRLGRLRSPRNRNCSFPGAALSFHRRHRRRNPLGKANSPHSSTGAIPAWTFSAICRTGIAVFPSLQMLSPHPGTHAPKPAEGLLLRDADGEGARRLTGYTQRRARALDTHFPRDAGLSGQFPLRGWQQGRCCTRPQCRRLGQRSRCTPIFNVS